MAEATTSFRPATDRPAAPRALPRPGRASLPLGGLPDPVREPAFYAGVPLRRALAWGIDLGVTLAICTLALPFTAFTALFWWPVLWFVVSLLYRWSTLRAHSATWGMALMGITIRERDGSRLSSGTALAHTLGYTVSIAAFPLQVISVALMAGLGRGQGLTDLLLGTAAIRRPL